MPEFMSGSDRTLAAAGLILVYAMVIGFTDNYVRVIAEEAGLWQFHVTRSADGAGLLALAAVPLGVAAAPGECARGGGAQSSIHGLAMVIYFGSAGLPCRGAGGGGAVHRADLRAADLALRLWPCHRAGADFGGGLGFVG
jgi:hypothetical protein